MGEFIKGIYALIVAIGVIGEGLFLIFSINGAIYDSGPVFMSISLIALLVVGILWGRKNDREEDKLYERKESLEKEINKAYKDINDKIKDVEKREATIKAILNSSTPFHSAAQITADIDLVLYGEAINYLKYKQHPAYSAAETVRELKNTTKEYLLELKTLQYKVEFLTSIYPELAHYIENESELLELGEANLNLDETMASYDRVRDHIPYDEYKKLSPSERNQLALDRWLSNVPKHWIGRIYEMYVAQEIKKHKTYKPSYKLDMYGIRSGVNDLGRDIIYYSESATYVIQCKCWAMFKEIHEKTMCQTLGTTVEFQVEKEIEYEQTYSLFDCFDCFQSPPPKAIPIVVTPTPLSDVAQRFAKHLQIKVITTKKPIEEIKRSVPLIKCNINNGERIYHLPFDQQYHRTIIDESKGEFYAMTVKEAEDKGFRRALKHFYEK